MSCRRFCNLVLEWLMQNVSQEMWEQEYKDVFFGDPKDYQRREEAKRRMAPSKKGQEGSLNIERKEPAKQIADLSDFFGRAGGAGRSDQNKAAMREIAESRSGQKSAMTIGPDPDGNLQITTPDDGVG